MGETGIVIRKTGISVMRRKQLCSQEIVTITAKCRERFLSLDDPVLAPLSEGARDFPDSA
jgi:hypothetical protein